MHSEWTDYDLAASEVRGLKREVEARIDKLEARVRVLENILADMVEEAVEEAHG